MMKTSAGKKAAWELIGSAERKPFKVKGAAHKFCYI
jgi:hypothetical protein